MESIVLPIRLGRGVWDRRHCYGGDIFPALEIFSVPSKLPGRWDVWWWLRFNDLEYGDYITVGEDLSGAVELMQFSAEITMKELLYAQYKSACVAKEDARLQDAFGEWIDILLGA